MNMLTSSLILLFDSFLFFYRLIMDNSQVPHQGYQLQSYSQDNPCQPQDGYHHQQYHPQNQGHYEAPFLDNSQPFSPEYQSRYNLNTDRFLLQFKHRNLSFQIVTSRMSQKSINIPHMMVSIMVSSH